MKVKKRTSKTSDEFLSTGCTLLNLALSDTPFGGYKRGHYYLLVGDSDSGKTFFSMTCFAEAMRNPAFKDYRRIYDNVEDGMQMDTVKLFGAGAAELIESPGVDDEGLPVNSKTVQEFYYHLDDAAKGDRPFIYVLDSMDSLEAKEDQEKFEKQKKAHRRDKEVAGSYGMQKAKANSIGLRRAKALLRDTNSILIIISQTRANVDPFSRQNKTRSGGKSLRFYSICEFWTSIGGQITKDVRKKKRKIGTKIVIELKKNHITGKLHKIWTSIYPTYGVDDIGSNIDFLVAEKWWKKRKNTILAVELELEATKEKLIRAIEEDRRKVRKLQRIVGKCWTEIEDAKALDRRGRYS